MKKASRRSRRLIRHRPLWPAAAIYFLWNFGPGWGTPMFYHLTEHVRISSELFGTFTALQSLFFLPTTLLYGYLCTRAPLSRLLWWGTIVAILQGPIMFLAIGPVSTIVVAILYGLFGGFATAAYIDLIMRSCPKGLEGTAMMLANTSMFAIAGNVGNLLGQLDLFQGRLRLRRDHHNAGHRPDSPPAPSNPAPANRNPRRRTNRIGVAQECLPPPS